MIWNILLACGILSSLFYITINILVPPLFEGYSSGSQTVSELSAIDAPTRPIWVLLASIYVILFGAFGFGITRSGLGNQHLRTTGVLIIIYAIFNIYWPPMHLRGIEPTLTDTMHIAWAGITIFLMLLIMGFGAAALNRRFRIYTIITFALLILFGILVAIKSPNIPKNLPTPNIGVQERILIAAFMLWIIVFSISLLRRKQRVLFFVD